MSSSASRVIETIVEFPSAIPVTAGTGGPYETRIAGRRVVLTLPSFRWRPRLDRYVALPPALAAVRSDVDWSDYLHTPWPWGAVSYWHGRVPRRIIRADVRHAVITLDLPPRASRAKVDAVANEIAAGSYNWWVLMRDWIEVATPHMLRSLDIGNDHTLVRNTRAWVWDGARGRSVPIAQSLTAYASSQPGLSRKVLQQICDRAGDGQSVPAMHEFLRNARVAVRQGRNRAAVLDSSTAAELALREIFDRHIEELPVSLSETLQSSAREMGRLVHLLRRLESTPLPAGIEQDLLHVRNRAIHRGAEPSDGEARSAVTVAATLVDRVAPAGALLL